MLEIFAVFMLVASAAIVAFAIIAIGWVLKMVFKIALFPIKLVAGLFLGVLGLVVALPLLVVGLPLLILAIPVFVVGALIFACCVLCWLAFQALAFIF